MAYNIGKYQYDTKHLGRFDPTLTQKAIQKRPFPSTAHGNSRLVAQWINSVVPSGERGYQQESFTTFQVLNELFKEEYSVIREALDITGYFWDYSDTPISYQVKFKLYKIANPINEDNDQMKEEVEIGFAEAKRKIEDLNLQYENSTANPALQKRIIQMVLDVLMQSGDGFAKMNKKKQEIEVLQEGLLTNARALRGNIYQMSSAELARIWMRPPPPGMVDLQVVPPRPRIK